MEGWSFVRAVGAWDWSLQFGRRRRYSLELPVLLPFLLVHTRAARRFHLVRILEGCSPTRPVSSLIKSSGIRSVSGSFFGEDHQSWALSSRSLAPDPSACATPRASNSHHEPATWPLCRHPHRRAGSSRACRPSSSGRRSQFVQASRRRWRRRAHGLLPRQSIASIGSSQTRGSKDTHVHRPSHASYFGEDAPERTGERAQLSRVSRARGRIQLNVPEPQAASSRTVSRTCGAVGPTS